MTPYQPARILVERSVRQERITANVLEALSHLPVEVVVDTQSVLAEARHWSPTHAQGKRTLVLARHRGRFFKPCPAGTAPGGQRNVCCNYFVVNFLSNCHMECSYCYLQTYLNFPHLVVYANHTDLLAELEEVFSTQPGQFFRVGTGELSDSLALDSITRYSVPLVEFFARQKNALLELKTKSDQVENLLKLEHGGRTVVAWSLNPEAIQRSEEHKTSSVGARLGAARRCAQAGYRVAFHLDPLIHYPDWERDYRSLVEKLFETVPADSMAWISLGSLRLTPQLKRLLRRRFPSSPLPYGELVPSPDGKLRYFKPIRIRMYSQVLSWIRRCHPQLPVYACMERPDVWRRVFQTLPRSDRELGEQIIQLSRSENPPAGG